MANVSQGIIERLRAQVPDIRALAGRFPWPVAAIIALTAATQFFLFDGHGLSDETQYRVTLGLSFAFTWTLAVTLWAERHGGFGAKAVIAVACGLAGLIVLLSYRDALSVSVGPLAGALALLLGTVLYLATGRDGAGRALAAFWQFNHRLWIGWVLAVVGGVLFASGVSLILVALDYLFSVEVPDVAYQRTWAVSISGIAPLYWLSVIPRDLEDPITEGPQGEFTSRGIGLLVQYILVPLWLMFAAILHAYAVKILLQQALPVNQLASMVLAFGTTAVVTALLAYPTRGSAGPLVAVFWRIWPWLMLVPLVMLALAIGVRIEAYGLTEQRYVVVLAGVWIAIVVAAFLLRPAVRDIRIIPAALALLLLAASFGPWGLWALPLIEQRATLERILTRQGVLVDGQIAANPPAIAWDTASRDRAAGALRYLSEQYALDGVKPWFAGRPDPFAEVADGSSTALERVALAVGLPTSALYPERDTWLGFRASQVLAVPLLAGAGQLIGPVAIYAIGTRGNNDSIALPGDADLTAHHDVARVTIRKADDERGETVFDLAKALAGLPHPSGQQGVLVLDPVSGATPMQMIVIQISGRKEPEGPRLDSLEYWLVLRAP